MVKDDVEKRLIDAALDEVAEHGYRGATTRAIARRAGVNEVTLFRKFGTKASLVERAIVEMTGVIRSAGQTLSDDVESDLAEVVSALATNIEARPRLVVRILSDLAEGDGLAGMALGMQREFAARAIRVMEHHVRQGRLADLPRGDLVRALLGPLVARAMVGHVLETTALDVAEYVRRFLHGHAGPQVPHSEP